MPSSLVANPIAAILSAAMMLDWLGQTQAAVAIVHGVEATLAAGAATPDVGGDLTTTKMTDGILERIG